MCEVVSVSGLFLAFTVTEKWVDDLGQVCVQVCDYVTQSENSGFKARYSASNKYKWDTLQHFIYQPRQRKQLCTGSWEGRGRAVCVVPVETQLRWGTFRTSLGWAGSWACPASACGWWPDCAASWSWHVLLWPRVKAVCSRDTYPKVDFKESHERTQCPERSSLWLPIAVQGDLRGCLTNKLKFKEEKSRTKEGVLIFL